LLKISIHYHLQSHIHGSQKLNYRGTKHKSYIYKETKFTVSKSFILIKSQEEKDQETKCCWKGDLLLKRTGKTAEECGNNVMVLIFNVFRVCNLCWPARMSLLLHMHTSRPPKTLQTKTYYCHLAVIFYYYKIQCFSCSRFKK